MINVSTVWRLRPPLASYVEQETKTICIKTIEVNNSKLMVFQTLKAFIELNRISWSRVLKALSGFYQEPINSHMILQESE